MALPALQQIDEQPPQPLVHRFSTGDLSKHGGWVMKRLLQAFPKQNERSMAGWLREIVNDNSSLFLATDNGVALFQVLSVHSLEHKPWIFERFVFAKEGYVAEGAEFYTKAAEWARNMGVEQIVVQQMSDIPADLIKDRLGRLFNRTQVFARL